MMVIEFGRGLDHWEVPSLSGMHTVRSERSDFDSNRGAHDTEHFGKKPAKSRCGKVRRPAASDEQVENVGLPPNAFRAAFAVIRDTVESGATPHSEEFDVSLTVAHITPIISLLAGVLILIVPALLNYIIAIYLIVAGVVGLNEIHHFLN